MPYVRKKGNQVVIVHGERDLETQKVQQQTLFVFYSKAEALAAIGDSSRWFQQSLQDEFPNIRFDWRTLNEGIRELMTVLPDLYAYKTERVEERFKEAMVDFVRELLIADPQMLMSSARLIEDHRNDLTYLRGLIDWRLSLSNRRENKGIKDDPFYWKTLNFRREVPIDAMEQLSELFLKKEYERAASLAELLIACWPNFAEGYNYLGLIALERADLETAKERFAKGMTVGRSLFPKRIRKDMYWSDHVTRPYIYAMIYSAQTLNRMGEFARALKLCEKLEYECGQDITAANIRISIYLNTGAWELAAQAARYVNKLYPAENLTLAFALYEQGATRDARVHFLSGAIRYPRAAKMLCGDTVKTKPKSSEEADDHNAGVAYLRDIAFYLRNSKNKAGRYFKKMLAMTEVRNLIEEATTVCEKWRTERSPEKKWFHRREEMESIEYAQKKVAEIWPNRR